MLWRSFSPVSTVPASATACDGTVECFEWLRLPGRGSLGEGMAAAASMFCLLKELMWAKPGKRGGQGSGLRVGSHGTLGRHLGAGARGLGEPSQLVPRRHLAPRRCYGTTRRITKRCRSCLGSGSLRPWQAFSYRDVWHSATVAADVLREAATGEAKHVGMMLKGWWRWSSDIT